MYSSTRDVPNGHVCPLKPTVSFEDGRVVVFGGGGGGGVGLYIWCPF